MKILHIAPTPFFADRGCHIRILGELLALQEHGCTTALTTYHIGRNLAELKIYRIINIPWYRKLEAGASWHKFYLDILLFFTSLKAYIKFRPDIIHGHLHEGALIGKMLSWIVSFGKTPVVFDVQGSLTNELKSYQFLESKGILERIFYSIEKTICKMPDHLVCSSGSIARFVLENMNVKPKKVTELIDGIYDNYFTAEINNELKSSLNIKNEKVVIYTGSLLKAKGIDFFLEAIPLILKKYGSTIFLIIGYPVEEAKLKAERWGISNHVRFISRVDFFKLPKYLRLAHAAVDPKVDEAGEGSGKIINYMGAGLPVVCFDTRNNRSFLGENGIYAEPKNIHDLADKILSVLSDSALAEKIGAANQLRVKNKFTWQEKGKDLKNIYEKLLNKSN